MKRIFAERKALSLLELNSLIRATIDHLFPDEYWVIAEIAEMKCNQRGHCYLDLVDKDNAKTVAQLRATIWASDYRRLSQGFQRSTGESLRSGMRVMVLAAVNFHEVYGLSLNIRDIDATYSVGAMAQKRREVIDRLTKEGLIDLNKGIPFPLVPQRVAVISSPTAAGYGDLCHQLDTNVYGYRIIHSLFPAIMQGEEAERSVAAALRTIALEWHRFNVVAIIRGGGSAVDLHCFDSYELGAQIARFALPVITGIGHEKDDTVVDLVAHTRAKTPTAVAEILITAIRNFEERILGLHQRLTAQAVHLIRNARHRIALLARTLSLAPLQLMVTERQRIKAVDKDLRFQSKRLIESHRQHLSSIDQAVRLLDPANVLRRGYSITRRGDEVLRDARGLKRGERITTELWHGTFTSTVEQEEEVQVIEQGKTGLLLPGFD